MDKSPGLMDSTEIEESSKKRKRGRRTGDLSGMIKNDLTGNNKDKDNKVKKRSKCLFS